MLTNFKKGDQIVYTPDHANRDMYHEDAEYGFVTSNNGHTVFCRFWNKYDPGVLRTRANSEGCYPENLQHYASKPQGLIYDLLDKIDKGIDP